MEFSERQHQSRRGNAREEEMDEERNKKVYYDYYMHVCKYHNGTHYLV
jgi:hypothetical protein